ncbi:MAG: Ig-like domain-containing protein, partial [Clostridia bacterium]|nr:Ig-like domain-containing protein [Clostridia bacterium]
MKNSLLKITVFAAVCGLLLSLFACVPEPAPSSGEDSVSLDVTTPPEDSSEETDPESEVPSEDVSEDSSEPEESPEESSEPEESGWKAFRSTEEVRIETYRAAPIEETGFSVLTTSLTVGVGKNSPVSYAFKPIGATNHRLIWTSSDPSVATVSESGVVTGVGVGSTYVTAETESGRKGSCKVTVVQKDSTVLGDLIDRLTEGTFSGWTFAYTDLDFDGEKELIARKADPSGVAPQASVYRVSDGQMLASFGTGDGEEWGLWTGTEAAQYHLISFKQIPEPSITRFAIELLLPTGDGGLENRRLY